MKQKIGIILIILLTSACGISTPQGYVLGTTGYLETFNAGNPRFSASKPLEQHQEQDREALSSFITKGR